MNKRYLLIFLIALATMAFGQNANPRLCQMDEYLQKQENITVRHFQQSGANLEELLGRIGSSPDNIELATAGIHHSWRVYFTTDTYYLSALGKENMRVLAVDGAFPGHGSYGKLFAECGIDAAAIEKALSAL